MSTPCSTGIIPGSIAAIVEATEEVKALRVNVKVQDHHDEEVEHAKQQDTFADALQSPAQHQPRHGRRRLPSCDGPPRQSRRDVTMGMRSSSWLRR